MGKRYHFTIDSKKIFIGAYDRFTTLFGGAGCAK
jgi:hypothetical protein